MSGLLKRTFRPWVKRFWVSGLLRLPERLLGMAFPAQKVKPVVGGADDPGTELAGQPGLGSDGLGRGRICGVVTKSEGMNVARLQYFQQH